MKRENFKTILIIIFIIFLGLASRLASTGSLIFDKYFGDALYAAMFFYISKLFYKTTTLKRIVFIFILMVLFEIFQLTGIPLSFKTQDNVLLKLLAFLFGTEFSFSDIFAYACGLFAVGSIETLLTNRKRT